jgi:hypothetical protein
MTQTLNVGVFFNSKKIHPSSARVQNEMAKPQIQPQIFPQIRKQKYENKNPLSIHVLSVL